MEITKRELLFSIVIIILSITIGLFVYSGLAENRREEAELYTKALKIQELEDFNYASETKVGNALVYSDCYTIESVVLPELKNEYAVIFKITEKYTKHTETYKDSNGNTKKEITYSWDNYKQDTYNVNKIIFMDKSLSIGLFNFNLMNSEKLKLTSETVSENVLSNCNSTYYYPNGKYEREGNIRSRYQVIPLKFSGTMFMDFSKSEFTKDNTEFYYNNNIEEVIALKGDTKGFTLKFCIWWIFGTIIVLFLFFVIDNKWLEDKGKKKVVTLPSWITDYKGKASEVIKVVVFGGLFLLFLFFMYSVMGMPK